MGFVSYFKQHNNQTFIAKIYGVFTIKSNIFNNLNVMIMQNSALLGKNTKRVCFDMKGSTINRKSKICDEKKGFWLKDLNYKRTLKDMNFVEINKDIGN